MEVLTWESEKCLKRLAETDLGKYIVPINLSAFRELKMRGMIREVVTSTRRIEVTVLGHQYLENKGLK